MTFTASLEAQPEKADLQRGGFAEKEQNKGRKETVGKDISKSRMIPVLLSSEKASGMSIDELERAFKTHVEEGLSEQEAKRRTKIYGPNDFDAGEDLPLWKKYLNQVRGATLCISYVIRRRQIENLRAKFCTVQRLCI